MIDFNPEALIKNYIRKTRFVDAELNNLANADPFDLAAILEQVKVLRSNADQSPNDAAKAGMLVKFINEALPEVIDPPDNSELRNDRHADKMQKRAPHFDRKALEETA
jgi:hypothetical protein